MTHSSETHPNQIHPAAIEILAVDAIHAVEDGTLGGMVYETNELLVKADAPVQVVEAPPRNVEDLIKRSQARTIEEKASRRLDVIHAVKRSHQARRSSSVLAMGRTLTARNR